jgi:hypothetical protein
MKKLSAKLETNTTEHWLAILDAADIWCAPVLTLPELGVKSEAIILIKTDLPLPEPPKITIDSPLLACKSMPVKTCFEPKFFLRSFITSFAVTFLILFVGFG